MAAQPIVHVEIPTANPAAAANFYATVFDWQVQISPEYPDYPMFSAAGGPGGGFTAVGAGPEGAAVPGQVLLHLASADIEADLARVVAGGGAVVRPKSEIPNVGWWAVFTDPDGNRLALFTAQQP